MDALTHQDFCAETAIYPGAGTRSLEELLYLGLGIASEGGEVAGKIKKLLRDCHELTSSGHFVSKPESGTSKEAHKLRLAIVAELGDVYWYAARLCSALGVTPEDVMAANASKLSARASAGTIGGSGDDR